MKRVYVAGAYSADNVLKVFENMRKGMQLSTEVFLAGYAPFCPWFDYHFALMSGLNDLTVDMFYEYSIAWLKVSDCMLLVPGWENSKGTLKEIEWAKLLNIPIYCSLDELKSKIDYDCENKK